MLKKTLIAAASLLAVVTAATSANAYPWGGWHGGWGGWHGGYGWRGGYGGWRGGYWGPGWGPRPGVFAAGVLGVAIGASLANPYYGAPPGYYAGPGYWGYYGGCRGYWRWAPELGRYVRDARCY